MGIQLREYQEKAITMTEKWMAEHEGNPCIVLATGSGKSIVLAEFIRRRMASFPDERILLLTHQKELVEQDADKFRRIAPDVPLGVYSAGVGEKDLTCPVTMASIQSIFRASDPGSYGTVVVDEAHLINNEQKGMYRNFLSSLKDRNPSMRVIGLTATPYRLGQGLIADDTDDTIFDHLVRPISTRKLIEAGYLSTMTTKKTEFQYRLEDIHKRGGEFIESELQQRINIYESNDAVADEIIRSADFFGKKHVLVFCVGVKHAEEMSRILAEKGWSSDYVTGSMDRNDRERRLQRFISGEVRALANANILTTGFDFPDIDCIVLLRPTMSTGLYCQMVGRGLRLKSDGVNRCLVLDFARNTMRHGPIDSIRPPRKPKRHGQGESEPKAKECPECHELLGTGVRVCPVCGYKFPIPERDKRLWMLYDGRLDDALLSKYRIIGWSWEIRKGKTSGDPYLFIRYYADDPMAFIAESFCLWSRNEKAVWHAQRALGSLFEDMRMRMPMIMLSKNPDAVRAYGNSLRKPSYIIGKKDENGFFRAEARIFPEEAEELSERMRKLT